MTTYWLLSTVLVIDLFPGLPYLQLLITYAKMEGEGLETYRVICGTTDVMILDATDCLHSYAYSVSIEELRRKLNQILEKEVGLRVKHF